MVFTLITQYQIIAAGVEKGLHWLIGFLSDYTLHAHILIAWQQVFSVRADFSSGQFGVILSKSPYRERQMLVSIKPRPN